MITGDGNFYTELHEDPLDIQPAQEEKKWLCEDPEKELCNVDDGGHQAYGEYPFKTTRYDNEQKCKEKCTTKIRIKRLNLN